MKKFFLIGFILLISNTSYANELITNAAFIEAAKECNKSGRDAYYNNRGYWQKIDPIVYTATLNHLISTAEMNLLMEGTSLDKAALIKELKDLGPKQAKNLQTKGIIKCN